LTDRERTAVFHTALTDPKADTELFLRIFILLFTFSFSAWAEAISFRLEQPHTSTLVGRSLFYAIDDDQSWTPEMVAALPETAWTRSSLETPNFGYLKKPLWIRLSLENSTAERNWILSFPDASFVQIAIWEKYPDGLQHLSTMNRQDGVAGRPIAKRYYNIPLEWNQQGPRTFYIRLTFQTTSNVPVTVEGQESFEEHYFIDTVFQSLYFGIMLSMFFYNGFLFLTTYDRSYLYYICYVLSLSLMMLWIRDWLSLLSPPAFILTAEMCNTFGYGVLLFGGLFVIHFIRDYYETWLLRALGGMCWLCLPLTASLYLYDNPVFNQIALVSLAVVMITSCVLIIALAFFRHRNRQTLTVLLAWSCVLLGGMLFSFNRNGLLPQTLFFDYSIQFGSALEALLLSFSLADKINHERNQKLIAQQKIEASEHLAREARAVQDALIHGQQEIPGVAIASLYQSADTTGGDWYAVFHDAGAKRLYLFMGDVTGHGIPSALVTAAVSGSIQSLVDMIRAAPMDRHKALHMLAEAVNRVVRLTGDKTNRMMTMAFVAVDLETRVGTFLNAGHRPPFLVHDHEVKPLICRGNMLGVLDSPEFEHKDFAIPASSTLALYTDGLFENQGPHGESWHERQLTRHLQKAAADPQSMIQAITEDLAQCWQNEKISDDCALLLIKFLAITEGSDRKVS
jgi:serine phosphatase RsbU (regulator of sigma subunit)